MSVIELNLAELDAAIERKRSGQTLADQAEAWSGDLHTFMRQAWPVLEPDTPFVDGPHIEAITDHLEAVSAGELRKLMINVPPATSKSTTVSVIWPVWDWIHKPNRSFITGSYHIDLSTDFAVKSRDLIQSWWFQSRWGHLFQMKGDENLKTRYRNDRRGRRYATSPGGGGTGQHANIIIVDDPHNAKEAEGATPSALQAAIGWQDGTLSTRFADPKTGAEVIIMQRLHEADLCGHLLAKEDGHSWTVLCLPEEYEPDHPNVTRERIVLPSGRVLAGDPRTVKGELLCPDRIGPVEHKARAEALGSFRASGQLQQRPTAVEGEILKRADWMFFPPAWLDDDGRKHLPAFTHVAQSWDTTFKDRTNSDFVVGQIWGVRGADRFLLRVFRARMNLTATKTAMREANAWATERWPRAAHKILIEKSANGVDIIADLKRELPGIEPIVAATDKTTRAIAASPALESGNVWIPGLKSSDPAGYDSQRTPSESAQLVEEAAVFPKGANDDSVDAFSQAMNWARGRASRARVTVNMEAIGGIGDIPQPGRWQ